MVWAVTLSAMNLIAHCLIAEYWDPGIRSLIGFGSLVGPLSHSVLYLPEYFLNTRPQAISERTSYHGV